MDPLETFDIWQIPQILAGFSCYVLRFALIVSGISVALTGIFFLFSAGNGERYEKAKRAFKYAILGIVIVYMVYSILFSILSFIGYTEWAFIPVCS